jgi:hypothetical protein
MESYESTGILERARDYELLNESHVRVETVSQLSSYEKFVQHFPK